MFKASAVFFFLSFCQYKMATLLFLGWLKEHFLKTYPAELNSENSSGLDSISRKTFHHFSNDLSTLRSLKFYGEIQAGEAKSSRLTYLGNWRWEWRGRWSGRFQRHDDCDGKAVRLSGLLNDGDSDEEKNPWSATPQPRPLIISTEDHALSTQKENKFPTMAQCKRQAIFK